jgi:dolichol kinase
MNSPREMQETKSEKPNVREVLQDEKGYFSPAQGAVIPVVSPSWRDLEIPRKFFHMFGSIIAWVYLFSPLSYKTALGILACYAFAMLVIDVVRLMLPSLNSNFTRTFGALMRSTEVKTLNTSTYFVLGSLVAMTFFPKPVAVVAILYLAFGDPLAAIVGMRFGKTRFFGKSIEGSAACFLVCLVIGLPFFAPPVALFGALTATLSELMPFPINDNFRIPILSGLALMLVI